jgi:hypothetical protein
MVRLSSSWAAPVPGSKLNGISELGFVDPYLIGFERLDQVLPRVGLCVYCAPWKELVTIRGSFSNLRRGPITCLSAHVSSMARSSRQPSNVLFGSQSLIVVVISGSLHLCFLLVLCEDDDFVGNSAFLDKIQYLCSCRSSVTMKMDILQRNLTIICHLTVPAPL